MCSESERKWLFDKMSTSVTCDKLHAFCLRFIYYSFKGIRKTQTTAGIALENRAIAAKIIEVGTSARQMRQLLIV